jgi:hypothetical protein
MSQHLSTMTQHILFNLLSQTLLTLLHTDQTGFLQFPFKDDLKI